MTCTNPRSRLRPLLVTGLLSVLACGGDDETGAVSVRYTLGAANSCATLDVQRVRVDVGTGAGAESAEDDCDPSQPIIIDGLEAGNYPMLVTAVDSMGFTVMDNQSAPTTDDKVEIVGGSSRDIEAQLAATPATIRVRWIVSVDGQPAQCTFVMPQAFEVIAYQNSGTSVLLTHQFECAQPPGFIPVPDANRVVNGQNLDAVTVRMLDENNAELERVVFEFEPPGPGRVIDLDVRCNEANGTVTCEGESAVGGGDGGNTGEPTGGVDPSEGDSTSAGDTSG